MDKVLFKLPVASYEFLPGGPIFKLGFSSILIACDYEDTESKVSLRLALSFEGIEVSKLVERSAIDVEVIKKAYEKVVDFGETEMLNKAKSNLAKNGVDGSDLRHLGIFFDGGPSLEIVCKNFKTVTERI